MICIFDKWIELRSNLFIWIWFCTIFILVLKCSISKLLLPTHISSSCSCNRIVFMLICTIYRQNQWKKLAFLLGNLSFLPCCTTFPLFLKLTIDRSGKVTPIDQVSRCGCILFTRKKHIKIQKMLMSTPESTLFLSRSNFFGIKYSNSWRTHYFGLGKVFFIYF